MSPIKKKSKLGLLLIPMAVFAVLFVVVPLGYVVVLSFLQRDEVFGVKFALTLSNYARMLDPMYVRVLLDSVLLALATTALTLLVGYPFAYYMAKLSSRTQALVMLLLIVPFWTNALVRLYGWRTLLQANGPVNSFLLWIGVIDQPLKLLYNYGAVLLGMLYALLPFMILPTYSSIEKMDWSMVEASRDLGAGPARAFFTVTLPLTLPGIMAGCVLVFVPSMGLFFVPDIMGGGKTVLMGNLIRDQLMKARDWAFGAALSVALLLATSLVLLAYRKISGSKDLGVFM